MRGDRRTVHDASSAGWLLHERLQQPRRVPIARRSSQSFDRSLPNKYRSPRQFLSNPKLGRVKSAALCSSIAIHDECHVLVELSKLDKFVYFTMRGRKMLQQHPAIEHDREVDALDEARIEG